MTYNWLTKTVRYGDIWCANSKTSSEVTALRIAVDILQRAAHQEVIIADFIIQEFWIASKVVEDYVSDRIEQEGWTVDT